MKPLALIFGAALALTTAQAQQSPFTILWDTYRTGQFSQVESYRTFVIRDQSQYESYWFRTTGNPPAAAPKDVNWLKNELLAIHLGQKPTGGYSVYVGGVNQIEGLTYAVSLVEQRPAAGARVTQSITSPFVIIRLPKRMATYMISKTVEIAPTTNPDPRPRPRQCTCAHCNAGRDCCCIGG
jgi:hypothetical protein